MGRDRDVTRSVIEYPTIRLENTSSTAHQATLPLTGGALGRGTSRSPEAGGMAVSHNRSGAVAVKSRPTRSRPLTGSASQVQYACRESPGTRQVTGPGTPGHRSRPVHGPAGGSSWARRLRQAGSRPAQNLVLLLQQPVTPLELTQLSGLRSSARDGDRLRRRPHEAGYPGTSRRSRDPWRSGRSEHHRTGPQPRHPREAPPDGLSTRSTFFQRGHPPPRIRCQPNPQQSPPQLHARSRRSRSRNPREALMSTDTSSTEAQTREYQARDCPEKISEVASVTSLVHESRTNHDRPFTWGECPVTILVNTRSFRNRRVRIDSRRDRDRSGRAACAAEICDRAVRFCSDVQQ